MSSAKILNERELAAELGLSVWTVRRMRLQEGLIHFTVGSRIFYRLEVVLAWIEKKETGGVSIRGNEIKYGKIRQID